MRLTVSLHLYHHIFQKSFSSNFCHQFALQVNENLLPFKCDYYSVSLTLIFVSIFMFIVFSCPRLPSPKSIITISFFTIASHILLSVFTPSKQKAEGCIECRCMEQCKRLQEFPSHSLSLQFLSPTLNLLSVSAPEVLSKTKMKSDNAYAKYLPLSSCFQ